MKMNSELPGIVKNYILIAENHFSLDGYRVKTLHADSVKDNLTTKLMESKRRNLHQ